MHATWIYFMEINFQTYHTTENIFSIEKKYNNNIKAFINQIYFLYKQEFG